MMKANDPRDTDGSRLKAALRTLGRQPELRARLVALLRDAEGEIVHAGSIRDDVTGPVVDALHDDDDRYERTLADGARFRYLFRTKIARDFLMAPSARPSHVWEPQTTKLLLHLAGGLAGDVVVGGAYFGDQAILVARAVALRGLVVRCFEPNPDQAGMLAENVQLNGLTNVTVDRQGLWSASGERLRLDGFDSFANAVAAAEDEAGGFDTVAIDDLRRRHGRPIGLIQLDIEGAEFRALQGAGQTLRDDAPAIVFEIHRHYVDWSAGLPEAGICRYLTDLGYQIFAVRDINSHREMPGQPVELIPADRVHLEGPPHGFNMLAVTDPAVVAGPAFRRVVDVSPKLLPHKDPALHHPLDGF